MSKITASCKFNGHDLTDIPVINPGGWFGKAWLVEIGGSFTPLFVASRIVGWTAHIMEQQASNALIRPLSAYNGVEERHIS